MLANILTRFTKEEEGASLVEYALLVALIAVACIGMVYTLGGKINDVFSTIVDKLTNPGGGTTP